MNVSLTPELEKFVQTKVQEGLYTSASEVVRAGLRVDPGDDHDALNLLHRLATDAGNAPRVSASNSDVDASQ